MIELPVVGVVPHEAVGGAYRLADVKSAMLAVPLREALERRWDTPALFVGYTVRGEKQWPRLNKLGPIREELAARGAEVLTTLFAFDYDRPKDAGGNKVRWTSMAEAGAVLARLRGAPRPTACYLTRHGFRLVYVLAEPRPVLEAEGYYAGMLADFEARGVAFDPSCQDWCRQFRLPFVTFDTGPTWGDPLIAGGLRILPDQRLDLSTVTPREVKPSTSVSYAVSRSNRPDEEYALSLIERTDDSNKIQPTAYAKRARHQLAGRVYWDALFDGAPLPTPEGRDNAIHKTVSSMVPLLMANVQGTSATHVFALMFRPVSELEPDAQQPGKDWLDVLWEKIERTWALEESKRDVEASRDRSLTDTVIEGYRQMLEEQGIDLDQRAQEMGYELVGDFVSRHGIATDGRAHYILTPDGSFSPQHCSTTTLVAEIQTSGMGQFYPLHKPTPERGMALKKPQEMIDECGVTYQRREGLIGTRKAALKFIGPHERVLQVPLYRLSDELLLKAKASPIVDHWLRVAFGEQYEKVCEWIAHSLDLYRGICALSIIGPPQSGKTLFAEVLAQCLHRPQKNDNKVFGRFNAALGESPVVHLDEGLEGLGDSGRSVDENFRVMTTGGQLVLEQKNQPTYTARLYPRLILTSNSHNILEAIVGKRDLTADARAALEERVLMVEALPAAQEFFQQHDQPWVEQHFLGAEMRAPRHFLWLYKNRKKPSGRRLLVEGERQTQVFADLSHSSPKAQVVIRALLDLMDLNNGGVEIDRRGAVIISAAAIEKYIEFAYHGARVTARDVGKVFADTDLATGQIRRGALRLWKLNIQTLLGIAEQRGKSLDGFRKRLAAASAAVPV